MIIIILIGCTQTNNPVTESPPGIRLTHTLHEYTITVCEGSGMIEYSGLDINYNSILDENEIDSINVKCDIAVSPELPSEEHDHDNFHCHKYERDYICKRKKHEHGS